MTKTLFDQGFFGQLSEAASASPRRRANANVHTDAQSSVQRLFITLEPDSYVRPHRHSEPDKWEFFWMVKGKIAFLIFDDDGALTERHILEASGAVQGLEIPAGTWHSVLALDSAATFFEVKQGPYIPVSDKDFATWAPAEGDTGVMAFMETLRELQPGDKP